MEAQQIRSMRILDRACLLDQLVEFASLVPKAGKAPPTPQPKTSGRHLVPAVAGGSA